MYHEICGKKRENPYKSGKQHDFSAYHRVVLPVIYTGMLRHVSCHLYTCRSYRCAGWMACPENRNSQRMGCKAGQHSRSVFLRGSVSQNFSHSEASRWDLVWGYCGPAAACYKNQASTTIRAYLKQTEKRSNDSV